MAQVIKVDYKAIKENKNMKSWIDWYISIFGESEFYKRYVRSEKYFTGEIVQRFRNDNLLMNQDTMNKIQKLLYANAVKGKKRMERLIGYQSSFDFISYAPYTDDSQENNVLYVND